MTLEELLDEKGIRTELEEKGEFHIASVLSAGLSLVGRVDSGMLLEIFQFDDLNPIGFEVYLPGDMFYLPFPLNRVTRYRAISKLGDTKLSFCIVPNSEEGLEELKDQRMYIHACREELHQLYGMTRVAIEVVRLALRAKEEIQHNGEGYLVARLTQENIGLLAGVKRENVTQYLKRIKMGEVFGREVVEEGFRFTKWHREKTSRGTFVRNAQYVPKEEAQQFLERFGPELLRLPLYQKD
ncbi:hypothetical protein DRJ48_02915 [Candidatus Woesearchaeota archaeon]|nr:MAG: hypothetical protein DRJ48_02915 [Candidatus Woesearchaeota archaeon]